MHGQVLGIEPEVVVTEVVVVLVVVVVVVVVVLVVEGGLHSKLSSCTHLIEESTLD